ncbi:alpha/beta fold hydrolase [Roseomonas sp. OT10]|uniref:bifunctional 3-oxoadipate enol-lactonase/4-carboxymuconolactone decarboxylase PcaDC n=1 Tax=Roseomonas cutis TaxID=2897332 RepID=UPI001E28BFB5|nr:alpha/beta fold hydrolase [Roseomonas sp. OT10]UFN48537.1 alpha/beta fold hydrolase [Roseomonas sp. OT10]
MFVNCGAAELHVVVEGPESSALPVLLLHSLGTDLRVWDEQAASLSRRYRVIRPDLRGHGLSTVTPGPGSMAGFAGDLVALLDALGLDRVHVAGLSIGGRIAMELAALAPARVASLMLCDTALEFPPFDLWSQRAATVRAEGMAAIADAVMARWVVDHDLASSKALRRMLLSTEPEGYAAAAEALHVARGDSLAGRIACPATVIVGERDQASPVSAAEAIRDAIPGASLVVIPGVAHIPTFEAAEAVTAALSDHLRTQEALAAEAVAEDPYAAGLAVRKAVLGEAHVARASAGITPLDAPFQEYITRNVWGGIWTRPGLPRRTRSLLTLAITAALAREGEFVLHVKATRNTGVTPEEIAEVLLQVGAYAGVPTANHALKLAKETLREMEAASA